MLHAVVDWHDRDAKYIKSILSNQNLAVCHFASILMFDRQKPDIMFSPSVLIKATVS